MSTSHLHVLNGDATRAIFERSGIKGQVIVWRDVLTEGPIGDNIHTDLFWEKRKSYMESTYPGDYTYEDKVRSDIEQLRNARDFGEVTLWFEYDLFCQVNMVACLSFFEHPTVSLVCLGDELAGRLQGLGEIASTDYLKLFEGRRQLTIEDLKYAEEAWKCYSSGNKKQIARFSHDHRTFKYLGPAFQAHIDERTPASNGLSKVERRMLQLIDGGIGEERKLVGTMLREQTWLGFGDLQYFTILKGLKHLLTDDFRLNDEGRSRLLA